MQHLRLTDNILFQGAGAGNLSAIGAAKADQRDRHVKQVGETEDEDTRMAE